MRIAAMLKTNDPAHFMIDLGTDRGFMFAYEVWKRDEWRGDRARLHRDARDIYATARAERRAVDKLSRDAKQVIRWYAEAIMKKVAA